MWIFAACLLTIAFILMVFFKDWSDALVNSTGGGKACPEHSIEP